MLGHMVDEKVLGGSSDAFTKTYVSNQEALG
jgi:hypothetical protein